MSMIGQVSNKERMKLWMALSIYYFYGIFNNSINGKDFEKLQRAIDCFGKGSCLFSGTVPTLTDLDDSFNSIITIEEGDVMTKSKDGTVIQSTKRVTTTFPEFLENSDLQMDQYVVGYDESSNEEIKTKLTDLTVFWNE